MTEYSTARGQKIMMAQAFGMPTDMIGAVNTNRVGDHGADPLGWRHVPHGAER